MNNGQCPVCGGPIVDDRCARCTAEATTEHGNLVRPYVHIEPTVGRHAAEESLPPAGAEQATVEIGPAAGPGRQRPDERPAGPPTRRIPLPVRHRLTPRRRILLGAGVITAAGAAFVASALTAPGSVTPHPPTDGSASVNAPGVLAAVPSGSAARVDASVSAGVSGTASPVGPALSPGTTGAAGRPATRRPGAPATDHATCGPTRILLSQGQPTVASSIEQNAFPAADAVDGNTTLTRWSSSWGDPQWIQVDLGASATVSMVVLYWEAAYATAFQIQVSGNGSSWTTIYNTSSGTGGEQTLTISGTGRYVRMYGTARAGQYGYSLFEFQVYGTPVGGGCA